MWIGVLCGLGAGAMWGLVFLMPAWLAGFAPLELAFGRYLAYGAIALLLMLPRLGTLLGGWDAPTIGRCCATPSPAISCTTSCSRSASSWPGSRPPR